MCGPLGSVSEQAPEGIVHEVTAPKVCISVFEVCKLAFQFPKGDEGTKLTRGKTTHSHKSAGPFLADFPLDFTISCNGKERSGSPSHEGDKEVEGG